MTTLTADLHDRRTALENSTGRWSIQFYGGWYVINARTRSCHAVTTMEAALDIAEENNSTGV